MPRPNTTATGMLKPPLLALPTPRLLSVELTCRYRLVLIALTATRLTESATVTREYASFYA